MLVTPRETSPTRGALLNASASLLESGGPEAVTLRSVGAAAGVSRSAAYRHFEDKADLLRALATQTLTDLASRIRADGAASGLFAGCLAYVTVAVGQPHRYQLIFGDSPVAQPGPEMAAAADDGMAAIQELVEQAQAAGDLAAGPPRELATILWVFLHGLAHLQITGHLREPRTVDGDVAVAELLELALGAMRPRDQATEGRSSHAAPAGPPTAATVPGHPPLP